MITVESFWNKYVKKKEAIFVEENSDYIAKQICMEWYRGDGISTICEYNSSFWKKKEILELCMRVWVRKEKVIENAFNKMKNKCGERGEKKNS
jgi:hypothetical protein